MELIDKDALVAEIEKRFDEYTSSILKHYDAYKEAKAQELGKILTIINTLEVKVVDLEKELDKYTTNNFWALEENSESPYLVEKDDMLKIAKHFYELGLKAQKGE
jgi:hypothetical protein